MLARDSALARAPAGCYPVASLTGAYSSVGRAAPLQGAGRGFKSLCAHVTTLNDARIRFIPRQVGKVWRVYDTFDGSDPYQKPGLGAVAQDLATEAEAQAEADRCNALHLEGKVKSRPRERTARHYSEDEE